MKKMMKNLAFLIYVLQSIFSEILCLDSHDLCEKLQRNTPGWVGVFWTRNELSSPKSCNQISCLATEESWGGEERNIYFWLIITRIHDTFFDTYATLALLGTEVSRLIPKSVTDVENSLTCHIFDTLHSCLELILKTEINIFLMGLVKTNHYEKGKKNGLY